MSWLVDQFFYETIGVPYHDIFRAFERSAPPIQMASMRDIIERRIHKVCRVVAFSHKTIS